MNLLNNNNKISNFCSLLFLCIILVMGCSSSTDQPKTESTQELGTEQFVQDFPDEVTAETAESYINQSIDNDNYDQAITLLARHTNLPNYDQLKEKVHLNYGLFYEYRGGGDMRSRMSLALRQFIKTLQVNSENPKARAEINQIMGVYSTFPNRTPPGGIVDTLQAMGLIE
mgnify:FL=1